MKFLWSSVYHVVLVDFILPKLQMRKFVCLWLYLPKSTTHAPRDYSQLDHKEFISNQKFNTNYSSDLRLNFWVKKVLGDILNKEKLHSTKTRHLELSLLNQGESTVSQLKFIREARMSKKTLYWANVHKRWIYDFK